MSDPHRFIDYRAAVMLVIASMIGTGVFTTLGLQAAAVPDGAALLLLWILGGLVALCGALSYAELAAAVPRSGGEYHFLSRIFHPTLGRLAGLISVTIGFSAPIALAAMALGRYAGTFLPADPMWIAVSVLLVITVVHAVKVELGSAFLVLTTLLKIAVSLLLAAAILAYGTLPESLSPLPTADTLSWVFSAPFGLSLVYVSYAYGGWNTAAYVVDEVRDPRKTVPRALTQGTIAVVAIYLLLNLAFLRTTGLDELAGTVEVGALSAGNVFGELGGQLLSLVVSLLLISTISAMAMAGPRVLQTMGEDIPVLRAFGARNRGGAPGRALLLQLGLALAFVLTDSFEAVLTFAGFTLSLSSCLTVAGVFWLRAREPDLPRPFRIPLYPLPPLIFLAVSTFALLAAVHERPLTVLLVLGLLALGGLLSHTKETP